MKKILVIFLMVFTVGCSNSENPKKYEGAEKPVIYLYPETAGNIAVELEYNGKLTFTYPEYGNLWQVRAEPSGKITNLFDNKEYSYLFWEGNNNFNLTIETGFVVKKDDTITFLQEKLAYLGLTPVEYNEFIVYWAPKLNESEYNLISFDSSDYFENTKLNISPQPDTVIRVFMKYKPLNEPVDIPEDTLVEGKREGFVVVEWGGSQVK